VANEDFSSKRILGKSLRPSITLKNINLDRSRSSVGAGISWTASLTERHVVDHNSLFAVNREAI
jgi:hypothetical protein